jgi:hypothetical protein
MRKVMIGLVLAGSMSLGACASDGYYSQNDRQLRSAGKGAAIGAAAGAGVGAVVDGVSVAEGAAAGAAVGAVVGAVTSGNHSWYRDNYGRCYYVDRNGNYVYGDRSTRC